MCLPVRCWFEPVFDLYQHTHAVLAQSKAEVFFRTAVSTAFVFICRCFTCYLPCRWCFVGGCFCVVVFILVLVVVVVVVVVVAVAAAAAAAFAAFAAFAAAAAAAAADG